MAETSSYDVLIIGSGIGALTTAAILSKIAKKKVLLLEKHWTVGGMTHEFDRKRRFSWDVGVHYIGQALGKELPAKIFRFISDGKLEWEPIPDPYDTFVYPDLRFPVPTGRKAYQAKLIELFPHEEKAILRYFSDMHRLMRWNVYRYLQLFSPRSMVAFLGGLRYFEEKLGTQTTEQYLNTHFKDERLKGLLVSQWGDYGLTPDKSAFWIHATIVLHYLDGAYYPKGGSKAIAESILPVIEKAGGSYKLNCEVKEILVENGKAVGCRCLVQKGKETKEEIFYAPMVISNAGAHATYRRLLREPMFPELDALQSGESLITVYLGLKESPEKLGVSGGNFWIYTSYQHAGIIERQSQPDLPIEQCFLSFPSLKDRSRQVHTAEMITLFSYDFFKQWADQPWRERDADYQAIKQKIADKLIELVEKSLPGFSDLIEYVEVSTPLTMEKFTNRWRGMMYNTPLTEERHQSKAFQAKTPIRGLFLTGADVFALGLVGAMMGGVASACAAMGDWSFLRVFPKIVRG